MPNITELVSIQAGVSGIWFNIGELSMESASGVGILALIIRIGEVQEERLWK